MSGTSVGPTREFARVARATGRAWHAGHRPWLACGAATLAVAATTAYRFDATRPELLRLGAVRATLPWWLEIARLPVSVFLPTPELPLAGAIAQLLLVLGIGQLLFGAGPTTLVAAVGQLVSTLGTRVLMAAKAAPLLGFAASQAGVLDTGPSGMTTAVGAWLLVRTRSWWIVTTLGTVLTAAAIVQHNLDGAEHLVAFFTGTALARLPGRRPTRTNTGDGPAEASAPQLTGNACATTFGSKYSRHRQMRPSRNEKNPT